MLSAQGVGAEAQASGRAWREVLDEHVCLGNEGVQPGLFLVSAQVERDRLLAPIDPDEVRRFAEHGGVIAAREVAFGTLDLDHASTGVGQTAGAVGRCHGLFERDDEDAFEWFAVCHGLDYP